MESPTTEDLVLAAVAAAEYSLSDREPTFSEVTETVAAGEQQLSTQVEVTLAIETLAEQGHLDRRNTATTDQLTLTATGRERARSIRDRLAKTEIELVDEERRQLSLGDAAAELDRSLVELAAECSDDGVYYLQDEVPADGLVDRHAERAQFERLLEHSLENRRGQILVLSGPSGIGKTTLAETVLEEASGAVDAAGVHCQEVGSEPYQPIREALEHAGVGNPFASIEVDAEEPEAYEAQQTALFHDVTEALTPEDGVRVLFLDDIDHADAATWLYLEYLCDRIGELPLVLVGTYRPGTLPEDAPLLPGRKTADDCPLSHIALSGLDREATEQFVAQRLNRRTIPGAFVTAIHERTDGNPLFTETTIDALLESDQLDPQLQWYPDDVEAIDLPDAVHDTIIRRLDSLDEQTRSVLEWSAVAGEAIPIQLLRRLSDVPGERLDALVETLIEAEVFVEHHPGERRRVTLRNDVVREALLEQLGDERSLLHETVAEELAALIDLEDPSQADVVEQASTIAPHHERAGNWEKAIEWYQTAAQRARDIYAHEAATEHYYRVLDIARSRDAEEAMLSAGHELAAICLTTSDFEQAQRYVEFVRERTPPEEVQRRCETARLEAAVAVKRGEFTRAIEAANEGLELTEQPDTVHCRLLAIKAEAAWRRSDYDDAEETCEQCRELAGELGDSSLEAEATEQLAMIVQERSEYDRAREYYEQALEKTRAVGNRHHEADIHNGLGIVSRRQGRPDAAIEYYEQALEAFEEIGDRHKAAKVYNNLAIATYNQGDLTGAERYYEQALEMGKPIGDRDLVAAVRLNLGTVFVERADLENARELLDTAIESFETADDDHNLAIALQGRGTTSFLAGRYDSAAEYLQRALDTFSDIGDDLRIAHAQIAFASLDIATGAYDRAATRLQQASSLLEDIDNPNVHGLLHGRHVSLARKRGEYETARSEAQRALEQFREQGIDYGVANVLSELASVALAAGDHERVRECLGEADTCYESVSNRRGRAVVDRKRGLLALEMDEPDRACDLLETTLATFEEMDVVDEAARTRRELGHVAAETGDVERAHDLWAQALETFEEIGARVDALETLEALLDHADAPADERAWCDRALEIAAELDTAEAADRREWFRQRREDLD